MAALRSSQPEYSALFTLHKYKGGGGGGGGGPH